MTDENKAIPEDDRFTYRQVAQKVMDMGCGVDLITIVMKYIHDPYGDMDGGYAMQMCELIKKAIRALQNDRAMIDEMLTKRHEVKDVDVEWTPGMISIAEGFIDHGILPTCVRQWWEKESE